MSDNGLPGLAAGQAVDVQLDLALNLGEGRYTLEVAVARGDWSVVMGQSTRPLSFAVAPRPGSSGLIDVSPRLRVG